MYKLLLVDDEADVREGVAREIDWRTYGFDLVGVAENGREAVEWIEREVPDLVVTDIRMPFMDGLELAEWLRKTRPYVKIVILTGYDEFQYARRAVRLRIEDYVLKPFSVRELTDALLKVKHDLDAEIAQRENVAALLDHYRKSLPVLREAFFGALVSGKLSEREIREKAEAYGIRLDADAFAVAVIEPDPTDADDRPDADSEAKERSGENASEIRPLSSLRDANPELRRFAVFNIAEEIVDRERFGHVFLHDGDIVWLAVGKPADNGETGGDASAFRSGTGRPFDREDMYENVCAVLEEIQYCVEKYLKLAVTAAVGSIVGSPADIGRSYRDALRALDYRPALGDIRVVGIRDVERVPAGSSLRLDELKERALVRCLKVGTDDELRGLIEDLTADLVDRPISSPESLVYLTEMAAVLLRVARDAGVAAEVWAECDAVRSAEWLRFKDGRQARGWLLAVSSDIRRRISETRANAGPSIVAEAKAYVLRHYADSELSVRGICAHLHVSAGYFCSLFKRETGMTFGQYVLGVRMEAAKELLRSTDLKTFEIAERVGYADPNYFSFCFKKAVGLSPKEYRHRTRGG
ncbi:MAG: hypothetical protein BLM47_06755 [Candidatus Reconcilbacillus cellulovorans]|uniref:DNA-binding response regulator n=1 Tax=Candidatus Reconcilbacillus cellulovorans TaxID=1906605 RepID=A0A2A6E192_9BACL|nr:MAG: hypothetical protein BLM47_06755 [Candidatus Reconcilbacillus cellulovorans]